MEKSVYEAIEKYMLSCMEDSAHDKEHVYRVLFGALEIAKTEQDVDYDVLIAACLLHDIGRKEQFENPALSHALVGAEKAVKFLTELGFSENFCDQVRHCIESHRFRKAAPPESIEAKILFDADKLEAAGAIGIARTLIYQGIVTHPLYRVLPDGSISDGSDAAEGGQCFFGEYKYKLENVYDHFYTNRGAELAQQRRGIATAFYESLLGEVREAYQGREELEKLL